MLDPELLLCKCDECGRKAPMLQGMLLAMGPGAPLVAELEADLRNHSQKVTLARSRVAGETEKEADANGAEASALAALLAPTARSRAQRPWLRYDPDALLPRRFDEFLLSGECPALSLGTSTSAASARSGDAKERQPTLCYVCGCGRSGTTVLSEMLSHYEETVFVNEPRQLWIPILSGFDVWSSKAPERSGRLVFEPEEAEQTAEASNAPVFAEVCGAYQRLLDAAKEHEHHEPRVILEKFPEHAFRLPFLDRVCSLGLGADQCVFLHLIRDGVAVARSIARFGNTGAWYGVRDDWKWRQLVALLSEEHLTLPAAFEVLLDAPDVKTKLFARGLVEWGLSVRAARRQSQTLGDRWLELRYEDLLANPAACLEAVEALLRLDGSAELRSRAAALLRPRADAGAGDSQAAAAASEAEASVLRALSGSWLDELLREVAAGASKASTPLA